MKNNKGFTIVELLSTFLLSSIIIILLFQMIINLKDIYQQSGIKTEMMNKQYIMTNKIYSDLNDKKAIKIQNCNDPLVCIEFTFQDGSIKKLEVDETNKKITYDGYIIKLNNTSYFRTMDISTTQSISNKKLFNANIPIYDDMYKNTNFGLNIVYLYDETEVSNNYGNKYVPPIESYISLPYVKSNGEQYINLGYKAKTNTEIRLDIEFIENSNTNLDNMDGYSAIIGRTSTPDNNAFSLNFGGGSGQTKTIYYWIDKTYASGAQVYAKIYQTVTPRSTMIVKSGSATFQGETINVATKTEDNTADMILLGGYRSDIDGIQPFTRYDTKIYGFQIYEGNNLVMNLTPAKSRETDKIGLYDTVSKQFFISNGTSDFIYE